MESSSDIFQGLHILLVSDDETHGKRLFQALRSANALVGEPTDNARDSANMRGADLILIDADCDEAAHPELIELRTDVRARWAAKLRISFAELVDASGQTSLAPLRELAAPHFEADRALSARAREQESFTTRLSPLGPSRTLRALSQSGHTLFVELHSPALTASVELSNDLLVCATAKRGHKRWDAWSALVRVLGMRDAEIVISRRSYSSAMNVMEPVDQALEVAAHERLCVDAQINQEEADAQVMFVPVRNSEPEALPMYEQSPASTAPRYVPRSEGAQNLLSGALSGVVPERVGTQATELTAPIEPPVHDFDAPTTQRAGDELLDPLENLDARVAPLSTPLPPPPGDPAHLEPHDHGHDHSHESDSVTDPAPPGMADDLLAQTPATPIALASALRSQTSSEQAASEVDAPGAPQTAITASEASEAGEASEEAEPATTTFGAVSELADTAQAPESTAEGGSLVARSPDEVRAADPAPAPTETSVSDAAEPLPESSHGAPAAAPLESEARAPTVREADVQADIQAQVGASSEAHPEATGREPGEVLKGARPQEPAPAPVVAAPVPERQPAARPEAKPTPEKTRPSPEPKSKIGAVLAALVLAGLLGGLGYAALRSNQPAVPAREPPAEPNRTAAGEPDGDHPLPPEPTVPPNTVAPVVLADPATGASDAGLPGSAPSFAKDTGEDAAALLKRAQKLAVTRDVAGARIAFEQLLAMEPINPHAHAGLAEVLLKQGDAAASLAHAQTALRIRPRRARYQVQVGDALVALGRRAEADAAFKKAYELDPNDPLAAARVAP